MEPFSMMLMMGAGLGMQAIGGLTSYGASQDYNEAQKKNIQLQNQVEAQRRQAMELDANRRKMENFRQVRRAQSQALATGVSQGAQFGSGVAGGQAQISGQGSWNELGINQNLQIGRNVFDLNAQISDQKIAMANAQQGMAFGQGLSSFGGSLVGAAGTFGKLTSGFGAPNSAPGNPWQGSYNQPGGYGYMS